MTTDAPVLEAEKEEVPTTEGAERTRARRAYIPRSDIYETDQAIVILADMPGVNENSIDITVEKNVLTLNGLVDVPQEEGYTLAYAEYEPGDYVRRFTLSDQIDQDGISANVKNGVLRLELTKAKEAKARKIEVKAG